MSKITGNICGALLIIGMIVWAFAFVLGGAEIVWWMLTGEFFHFVSVGTSTF